MLRYNNAAPRGKPNPSPIGDLFDTVDERHLTASETVRWVCRKARVSPRHATVIIENLSAGRV